MAKDIAHKRQSCHSCNVTAPSQSPEPPITPITPQYPFQHIVTDYFSLAGQNFCLVVDKFSNWLQIYRGKGGSSNPIPLLGDFFHSFGNSESLTTDGGPKYTADDFKDFLKKLGITHRVSSIGFPHGNQKVERSVAAAKRRLQDAVRPTGDIDTGPDPRQHPHKTPQCIKTCTCTTTPCTRQGSCQTTAATSGTG